VGIRDGRLAADAPIRRRRSGAVGPPSRRTCRYDLRFFDARLEADTAQLARGFPAICAFVNDQLDRPTLTALAAGLTLASRQADCSPLPAELLTAQRLHQKVANWRCRPNIGIPLNFRCCKANASLCMRSERNVTLGFMVG